MIISAGRFNRVSRRESNDVICETNCIPNFLINVTSRRAVV